MKLHIMFMMSLEAVCRLFKEVDDDAKVNEVKLHRRKYDAESSKRIFKQRVAVKKNEAVRAPTLRKNSSIFPEPRERDFFKHDFFAAQSSKS